MEKQLDFEALSQRLFENATQARRQVLLGRRKVARLQQQLPQKSDELARALTALRAVCRERNRIVQEQQKVAQQHQKHCAEVEYMIAAKVDQACRLLL